MFTTGLGYGGYGMPVCDPLMGGTMMGGIAPMGGTIITETVTTGPTYGYGLGGVGYPMGGVPMGGIGMGMGYPATYTTFY